MHDKRQMKRYRCMWTLIGLEICLEKEHDRRDQQQEVLQEDEELEDV